MKTISILLVDDDPFIREVLDAAFSVRPGARVQSYASPADALIGAQAAPPDIIVLDYTLPGTDGLAVYRALCAVLTPMPPVVFLTAREDRALVARLMSEGASGVLAKPFDPISIADQILRLGEARTTPPRDARLDAVAAGFRASLPQTMTDIGAEWSVLRREWRRPVAESLVMRVHKLAGAAGLFKMHAFGLAAREVEVATHAQLEAETRGAPVDRAGIEKAIAVLWETAIAAMETPPGGVRDAGDGAG